MRQDAEDTAVVMGPGSGQQIAGRARRFWFWKKVPPGLKLLYVAFPLYLLPDEAKTRLVLNAVEWMLGKG